MLGAAREQQKVVSVLAAVSDDGSGPYIDCQRFGFDHTDIAVGGEQAANRHGDVGGAERSHRNLVEKRLKQMMVFAIDDGDAQACDVAEALRRVEAGEPRANDDDMLFLKTTLATTPGAQRSHSFSADCLAYSASLRESSICPRRAAAHSMMGSTRGETSFSAVD